MRFELECFGITACTVAPGAFKTGFGQVSNWNEGNPKKDLNELRESFKMHYSTISINPPKPFGFGDPKYVAELIYDCVQSKRGHHNFVGKDAKMLTILRKFLPQYMMDNMFKNAILPKIGNCRQEFLSELV